MKQFEKPFMNIQRLDPEDLIRTSGCSVEARACLNCYCSGVTCSTGIVCTQLDCPTLQSIWDAEEDL